jgi:hypothetical protein
MLFLGVEESVVVSMPSQEGSLKQYTDTPPVLDGFKKWFLHGICGEAYSYIQLSARYRSSWWFFVVTRGVVVLMLKVFAIIMILIVAILTLLRVGYGLIRKRLVGFLFLNKYFSDFYLSLLILPSPIRRSAIHTRFSHRNHLLV